MADDGKSLAGTSGAESGYLTINFRMSSTISECNASLFLAATSSQLQTGFDRLDCQSVFCVCNQYVYAFNFTRRNIFTIDIVAALRIGSKWTARQTVLGWRHFEVKERKSTSYGVYALLMSTVDPTAELWVCSPGNLNPTVWLERHFVSLISGRRQSQRAVA